MPPHVASFAVVLLLAPTICGWPHAAGRSAEASVYPAAMSSAPIAITNAIRGAEDGFAFDCIAALLYVSGEEDIVLLILPFLSFGTEMLNCDALTFVTVSFLCVVWVCGWENGWAV